MRPPRMRVLALLAAMKLAFFASGKFPGWCTAYGLPEPNVERPPLVKIIMCHYTSSWRARERSIAEPRGCRMHPRMLAVLCLGGMGGTTCLFLAHMSDETLSQILQAHTSVWFTYFIPSMKLCEAGTCLRRGPWSCACCQLRL